MASRALTVEEIVAILAETPGRIAALTEGLRESRLHTSPEPDGRSVNDALAHLRARHDAGWMARHERGHVGHIGRLIRAVQETT